MKIRPDTRRVFRVTIAPALAGLLAIAGFLAGPPPAAAQSSIKVIVSSPNIKSASVITTYDISNRTKLLRLTSRGRASRAQATEELIDEQLKLQEAARQRVSVSDEQVERAFGQIASRAKLTPARLSQALRQSGVNPQTLKDRLRSEIAWSQIVRARFQATVKITERDVALALAGKETAEDADTGISQFDLQPIIFVIPAKASKGHIAQRRREAEAFRSRYAGCDQALDQAKKLKGVIVMPKIRRTAEELRGAADSIAKTEVGKTTRPEKVAQGYQLLGVCAKRDLAGQSMAAEEVRDKLSNERGTQMARRFLRDLRSQAIIDYR
ncbi:MAG: SurA N-terminal domain-containing protein [Hyphomicrobiales bacterium]|nr:SurA N-terminal domain-containing protein [Hyphomicrobiales bacterium]